MIDVVKLRRIAAGDDDMAEVRVTKRLLCQVISEIEAGRLAELQLRRQTQLDALLLDISGTVTG
ncbi:hypothetical protein [Novosphingobium sp. EMRT-2]|uniref:hypothetical protein n=1 Tax=Novosphingobium sp. EMRT-2 TaxID=2571749 RepID=UPI0010BD2702|nr:hypothetical protein [Novosphingobium sp. EMRT-2]QCI92300.1 hypothetical protein FA702_01100 [Novosphingobium sp. EMRT-2]